MLTIIALTGHAHSGKSTTARGLVTRLETLDYNVRIESFASEVKREVALEFSNGNSNRVSEILKEMYTPGFKEKYRPILQAWGNEKRVLVDQNYWVDKLLRRLPSAYDQDEVVIIDDMRYPNEAEAIRKLNSSDRVETYIIKLRDNPRSGLTGAAQTHASERGVDEIQGGFILEWMPVDARVDLIMEKIMGSTFTGVSVAKPTEQELIYLASPYSAPDTETMTMRYYSVMSVWAQYLKSGEVIFCPIGSHHPVAQGYGLPREFPFWEKIDTTFLKRCDKLRVLMLNGWKESTGVTVEIKFAEENEIPIEYAHLDGSICQEEFCAATCEIRLNAEFDKDLFS